MNAAATSIGPLFDRVRQPSRNKDLDTSHRAARELQTSGRLTEQCEQTLVALVRWEVQWSYAPSSHELAAGDTDLRYQYARRLPDLEHAGLVTRLDSKRACRVTGRLVYPWRATEAGMTAYRGIKARSKAAGGAA